MTTFSIIQKSQLEGAIRLDAEYYQPEYLEIKNILNGKNISNIREISSFVKKGIFDISPNKYRAEGIPLLRVQNIKNGFVDDSNLVYLCPEDHERENKTELENFDLVFSKIGTIGEVALLDSDFTKWNFSQNVIGVKVSKNKINPAYLLFFLLSKLGQLQIKRAEMGQVQLKLELEDIRNLGIVRIRKEEEFSKYLDDILSFQKNSKFLYHQAENLLLEELGLKNFNTEENLSAIVNFSDILEARRMDAEYFQPKYEKLFSKIKAQNVRLLSEVIENVPAKFNPLAEPDKLFKYVELSNIDSSAGTIDGFSETSGREAPGRAKRFLKIGDVLVSSVEGSLGKVALVEKEQEGHLASTGFFQFRSEEILPEVILVLAKSIAFQMQLEKQCSGTILTAVPKEAINNIYIPILEKSIQQKIADLVCQSHEARKKAKELLGEAKRKVEEMIEKGGEEA